MAKGLKRGIYLTEYGNAAYVSGPKARTAYDLDMAERISMALVSDQWVRGAEQFDSVAADAEGYEGLD